MADCVVFGHMMISMKRTTLSAMTHTGHSAGPREFQAKVDPTNSLFGFSLTCLGSSLSGHLGRMTIQWATSLRSRPLKHASIIPRPPPISVTQFPGIQTVPLTSGRWQSGRCISELKITRFHLQLSFAIEHQSLLLPTGSMK